MAPFRDTVSVDVLRGQMEILQKENSLLKREMRLQEAQQELEVVLKESAVTVFTKVSKPITLLALIAAAVVTGNGWFLVLVILLAYD